MVERKDIAKAPARLLNDVGRCVLCPADGTIEPVDQRIQALWRHLVQTPEIGHDARADLAVIVAKRLDQLQL